MILQALVKYYEDLVQQDKVSTRGWCQAKVSCAIELHFKVSLRLKQSFPKIEHGKPSLLLAVVLYILVWVIQTLLIIFPKPSE